MGLCAEDADDDDYDCATMAPNRLADRPTDRLARQSRLLALQVTDLTTTTQFSACVVCVRVCAFRVRGQ